MSLVLLAAEIEGKGGSAEVGFWGVMPIVVEKRKEV